MTQAPDTPTDDSTERPSTTFNRRYALGAIGVLGVSGALALRRGSWLGSGTAAAQAAACYLMQEVTQGPYYIDERSLLRQDITEGRPGMPLTLTLNVLGIDNCAPVADAIVELWHADASGLYSGFNQPGGDTVGETFLRGAQVTDADGNVTFVTIYPGWYNGRAVHMHVKVHAGDSTHTGQLFFPDSVTDTVYTTSPYKERGQRSHQNADDSIYAASGSTSVVTIAASGSGYAASNVLGIAGSGSSGGTDDGTTPTTSPATVGNPSAFVPLAAPVRILDTRSGVGYSGAKPSAGATVVLGVAGQGGIPSTGASAVILNVTADAAAAPGFVTVWPEGDRPVASSLNLDAASQTRPNLVTVPIGSDGAIRLFTQSGTHLVADAIGYFREAASARGGRLQTVTPARILDTRNSVGYSGAKPAANAMVTLSVAGRGGVPTSGASAVILNVTVAEPAAAGYVTVWPQGAAPGTSNLNVAGSGEAVANQVIVPLGADGAVRLLTTSACHLIADVTGWFTDDTAADATTGLFVPVSPYRVLDTRTGDRPTAGTTVTTLLAAAGTAAEGTTGVVMNLTATETAAAGFVTAWPEGALPTVSCLNVTAAGQTIANHAVCSVGSDGGVRLYTYADTHLVADVTGWFLS